MKKLLTNFFIFILLLLPLFVTAAGKGTPGPSDGTQVEVNIKNPTKAGDTLMEVLVSLLNKVVMPVAAVAVVLWIVYAGFTFVTAQGKPKEIGEAQQRLLWSLIGAGVLLGAAGISSVVERTIKEIVK
jgi:hypothetical protein